MRLNAVVIGRCSEAGFRVRGSGFSTRVPTRRAGRVRVRPAGPRSAKHADGERPRRGQVKYSSQTGRRIGGAGGLREIDGGWRRLLRGGGFCWPAPQNLIQVLWESIARQRRSRCRRRQFSMKWKHHSPEQIIHKLRQGDAELVAGGVAPSVIRFHSLPARAQTWRAAGLVPAQEALAAQPRPASRAPAKLHGRCRRERNLDEAPAAG